MPTPAAEAPPVDVFAVIPDLFDELAALSRRADVMGWRFPPEDAARRRALLHQIRHPRRPDGRPLYSLANIAARVNLGKTRLRQLLTAETRAAQDCAPAVVLPSVSGSLVSSQTRKTATAGDIHTVAAATS